MSLPVVDPPSERDGDSTVAGVLLAAGTSSRYGDANKLLEAVDGEPMVRRSARTLLGASLDSVTVVLGCDADRVRDALDGLPVDLVANPDYETGQASSVRRAVDHLRQTADPDAAVFALGDMPYVDPASVDALAAAFDATGRSALAAGHDGQRGNPVLFAAEHFDALADISGDTGGRRVLLDADDAAVVATGDSGVRRDVDKPDDLA
ncbi:nucleotidyltransferase family protein [Halobacterium jilantaiense]|uniref:Molybdenum cofactor cytidylyltransferase n=1 Tax=Halobacterium jilantaiense TaxID=355548 RepID=A0A1I0QWB7_9EURY|nr:nucleotidyltransferase family protein [Halobacterium jilantaiense]SEW31298.1 molybdenum cofactor cytidylyltransferase [Halobacterium jilantaiense]